MKTLGLFFLFAFTSLAGVVAQSVSVQASLSHTQAGVGEPVQLTISVTGARQADIPDNFAVDGLPIVQRSQSTQVNIINFQMTATVNYTFVLLPQREGTYTIPSLAVRVGDQIFRTDPLTLEVTGSAMLPAPGTAPSAPPAAQPFRPPSTLPAPPTPQPRQQQQGVPIDQIARMELIVPQTEVYVGQVVPVELRVLLDQRFQFELGQLPEFSGEGFVAEKLSEPEQRQQVIDGVPYQVITFYSTLTAVKAGPLQIPPARLTCNVIVPGGPRGRSSIFDDFFGGDPFAGMFGERRQIEVQSNAVELTALAVPMKDRPPDFSGAIGQFSISQRMEPSRAEVGEPMKLIVDIEGTGNFKALTQPRLEETDGWRIYSGGDKFTPFDSVGFGGRKTFDITIMPTREVKESPVAQLTYFDPVERKFVTIRGEAQPVVVRGGAAPAPTPTPPEVTVAAPTPAVAAPAGTAEPAATGEGDTELQQWAPFVEFTPGKFVPIPLRTEFLVANAAALVAVLSLLGVALLRRHAASDSSQIRKLRRLGDLKLHELQNPNLEAREFYRRAEEFIREQGRIASGNPAILPDAHDVISNPILSPEVRDALNRVLSTSEEMRFSSRPRTPSALERDNALEALRMLHRALNNQH